MLVLSGSNKITRDNIGFGGAVLQVAYGSTNVSVTNNSSTWVATGLSASLTPRDTSSKILAMVNMPFQNGSNNYVYNEFRLMRNGSMVYYTKGGNSVSAYVVEIGMHHFTFVDNPASASALTYTVDFRTSASAGEYGGEIFNPGAPANVPQLILMEIAG